jgi:hypothetical protein
LANSFESAAAGKPLPFVWGFDVTVDVDERDEDDAIDDAEFDRWMGFRGGGMPLTSSAFIGLNHRPLRFGKLGGAATAVIEKAGQSAGMMNSDRC